MRPTTPKSAGGQLKVTVHGLPLRPSDAPHSDEPAGEREYTQIKELGKGRSSSVWLATWGHGGRITPSSRVAVKRRRTGFTSWSQCSRSPEVQLFESSSTPSHPHILSIFEIFLDITSTDLYIVLEPLEGSLRRLIKARKGLHFPFALLASIFTQAVSGTSFLHSLGYVHRALDAEAILVTTTGLTTYQSIDSSGAPKTIRDISVHIKVGSLGSATRAKELVPLPHYALLGPTAAPEMIIKSPSYTCAVDLWSLGTIFGEVINLRTLFNGHSPRELFEQWCEALDTPTDHSSSESSPEFAPEAVSWAAQQGIILGKLPSAPLRTLINFSAPDSLVECITSLLAWNPSARPSAASVLALLETLALQRHHPILQSSSNSLSLARINSTPQHDASASSPDEPRSRTPINSDSPIDLPPGLGLGRPSTDVDAISLAPSYYSRLPTHAHQHSPQSPGFPPSTMLPHYDDIAANPSPNGLGDYFARVLAGGALITATSAEFRAYVARTPRMGASARVVQCIRRSEVLFEAGGGSGGEGGSGSGRENGEGTRVRHECILVQCALGSDKGAVWLRLERRERVGSPPPSTSTSTSGTHPPPSAGGTGSSWPRPADTISISSTEIELYDKDLSRVEAHYVLSSPLPLHDLARILELVADESRDYRLWPENRFLFASLVQELVAGRASRGDLAPDIRHRIRAAYFPTNAGAGAGYGGYHSNASSHTLSHSQSNAHFGSGSGSGSGHERGYTSSRSAYTSSSRPPRSASASGPSSSHSRPSSASAQIATASTSTSAITGAASRSRPSSSSSRAQEAEQMRARARAVLKKRGSYVTTPEFFAKSGWEGSGSSA